MGGRGGGREEEREGGRDGGKGEKTDREREAGRVKRQRVGEGEREREEQ